MKPRYHEPIVKEKEPAEMSVIAKSAYFLCTGAISTLISILSLLLVFALISLLTGGLIPGVIIPEKIPVWGTAIILLVIYTIIVLPLKALRYSLAPHKAYSIYGGRPSPKYGDATLWLALFILLGWYFSEHREGIQTTLGNFANWWPGFVDTIGPWFYQ